MRTDFCQEAHDETHNQSWNSRHPARPLDAETRTMRVLVLGAGASVGAGYPVASELMERVGKEAIASRDCRLERSWAQWQEIQGGFDGPLGALLRDPNPEIALSAIDLCRFSLAEEYDRQSKEIVSAINALPSDPDSEQRAPEYRPESKELQRIDNARRQLLQCLHWYFVWQHHQDGSDERMQRRKYLTDILASLDDGDVVITFNWDTTAERTLGCRGKWRPHDGYGFRQPLRYAYAHSPGAELSLELVGNSTIPVLKLHGSVGWALDRGRLRFLKYEYLDRFGFRLSDTPVEITDTTPLYLDPPGQFALAYPSYLKSTMTTEIDEIWLQADSAMRSADRVDVYGYSLPHADIAARTLFRPLRERIRRGAVDRVAIHDKSESTLDTWCRFLGDGIELLREVLEASR